MENWKKERLQKVELQGPLMMNFWESRFGGVVSSTKNHLNFLASSRSVCLFGCCSSCGCGVKIGYFWEEKVFFWGAVRFVESFSSERNEHSEWRTGIWCWPNCERAKAMCSEWKNSELRVEVITIGGSSEACAWKWGWHLLRSHFRSPKIAIRNLHLWGFPSNFSLRSSNFF